MSVWEYLLYVCAAIGAASLSGALVLVVICTIWQWLEIVRAKPDARCPGYGLDGDGREADCGCVECAEG